MNNPSEFKRWAVIGVIVLLIANYGKLMDTFGPGIEYDASRVGAVTLYGTRSCGYCSKARRLFERHDIPFADLDIEKSQEAREAFHALGGRGVPLITIGDKAVYGYNYQKIRSLLHCDDC